VAVSPIVGGTAIKGPAAKMLAELGEEVSALAIARRYRGLCDIFVLDLVDHDLAEAVNELGMRALVTKSLMETEEDKINLAREIVTAAGVIDV
jgi:LPPG:FO 2-phospho-L-lactate transferase